MELTFEEVIARIKADEVYECTVGFLTIEKIYKNKRGSIKFEWKDNNERCGINPMARFKLKPSIKPVTFSEAMASGKKVRFGRNIDTYTESDEYAINSCLHEYSKGEYLDLSDIMSVLGWMYNADNIKEILEGDWYIEN